MIFNLSIQYDLWLAKRKPTDKFTWGHTSMEVGAPIKIEKKIFSEMDEEEKEAAFRRNVFETIHKHMLK